MFSITKACNKTSVSLDDRRSAIIMLTDIISRSRSHDPWCRKRLISRAIITPTDTQVTGNAVRNSVSVLVVVSLSASLVPSHFAVDHYVLSNRSTSEIALIASSTSDNKLKGDWTSDINIRVFPLAKSSR